MCLLQNRLCTDPKPTFSKPALCLLQNRLCADPKPTFPKPALCLLQNRLCVDPKPTAPKPALCLLQNQLCVVLKPAAPKPALCLRSTCRTKTGFASALNLPFHLNNISTVSEVRCDCQGLGLVACIEASILVFDTKQVLYWPVLGQIQFCSFDRRCKTCLDTKPVLYQGRFCSLTSHQMETFSVLLALCAGNPPVTGELPSQRPVARSFDVFFDLRLNKRLSKQSRRRWF